MITYDAAGSIVGIQNCDGGYERISVIKNANNDLVIRTIDAEHRTMQFVVLPAEVAILQRLLKELE